MWTYIILIVSLFLYFPSIFFGKISAKYTTNNLLLIRHCLFRSIIGCFFGLLVALTTNATFIFDKYTIIFSVTFGVMLAVCLVANIYAFRVAAVSTVNMFVTVSAIIPSITGILFFNEKLTVFKVLGFILFVLAVYLITLNDKKKDIKFTLKAFIACFIVFLTSGLGSVSILSFAKCVPTGDESIFMLYSYIIETIILAIVFGVVAVKTKKTDTNIKVFEINKPLILFGLLCSIICYLLQQFSTILASEIPSLFLFPLTNSASVIAGALIGLFFFEEKLTVKNILGIAVCIIALIILNL